MISQQQAPPRTTRELQRQPSRSSSPFFFVKHRRVRSRKHPSRLPQRATPYYLTPTHISLVSIYTVKKSPFFPTPISAFIQRQPKSLTNGSTVLRNINQVLTFKKEKEKKSVGKFNKVKSSRLISKAMKAFSICLFLPPVCAIAIKAE